MSRRISVQTGFAQVAKALFLILSILLSNILLSNQISVRAQTGGPEQALTLPLAVEIALRSNPLIKATNSGREFADASLAEARAARLPILQLNENFARSNNPVFVFGSLLEQGRFGPQNFNIASLNNPSSLSNFRTSLNIKTPLFDQFKTTTRIAEARLEQQRSDKRLDQIQQQLRFEVIRAYYGLLISNARKKLTDDSIKMAEADAKQARDMFESGLIVEADVLAADVQVAEFRQQQIEAAGNIIISRASLNTVLGLPLDSESSIQGEITEMKFDPSSQSELIRQALLNRPDYAQAALGIRQNEQRVRGTKGENLPKIDFFASYGNSGNTFGTGSADYTVGANLTISIFDQGRAARINQAKAQQAIALAEQEQLGNQIRLDVVKAYQQFISARERLNVIKRAEAQAVEALRIVQDRYREGLSTITELLRAENALNRLQLDLLAARYDQYVGYAGVLLATGLLNDVRAFVS